MRCSRHMLDSRNLYTRRGSEYSNGLEIQVLVGIGFAVKNARQRCIQSAYHSVTGQDVHAVTQPQFSIQLERYLLLPPTISSNHGTKLSRIRDCPESENAQPKISRTKQPSLGLIIEGHDASIERGNTNYGNHKQASKRPSAMAKCRCGLMATPARNSRGRGSSKVGGRT